MKISPNYSAINEKIMCSAIEKFGEEVQINKLKEEIFELGTAICHYEDGKIEIGKVTEEIADVYIMLWQYIRIKDIKNINEEIEKKLTCLNNRL
jgi:NTP pyrophosphatase (non-canonical NTP hydrolase)